VPYEKSTIGIEGTKDGNPLHLTTATIIGE
jgi:hypothetical protein